jgi:hypothetical protein
MGGLFCKSCSVGCGGDEANWIRVARSRSGMGLKEMERRLVLKLGAWC